ncbi:MAG: hypothetical protein IKG25_00225 [Mogibacterium sp.]|nr:hypothetical protein [Mogibacterium sp.]MBR4089764.1 hypothetical protein [Mogibacterium sp.]
MDNRSFRKIMALTLAALMTFGTFMLTGCGKSYEHIFGDVEWLSTYKEKSSDPEKTIKDTFYYSDDWFSDSPSSENKELALASMQLIASCVSDDTDSTGAAFLKSMGFEEVGFSDFASSDPDDCNYTWARKSLGDSTLVAVTMQSVNRDWKLRNKAWKQNFTVNEPGDADPSGEHYAYAKAADKVIDDIAALAGDGDAVFWIMGQSRGGAIADILAVRLREKLDKAKIFAYTFEAPATVDADAAGDYKFIHNYICSDDIVTHVPMWGMTRYGVMHDLKTKETDEGLDGALEALGSDAAGMKARIVTDDVVARLSENLEARVPSRAEFSAERTDSWTDADGKRHDLTYSYQEALAKFMDLVFSEDSSGSLFEGLASKRGDLEGSIGHLSEGVKAETGGNDPSAEYWEAAAAMYAVLSDADGGLPISEEDLYEVVRLAAPVLITIPEDGGEPDTELLTDVIGYNRELIYSHQFDTIIARLKILAPTPER